MKPILDKELREQEIEKIFSEPPLPESARAELGDRPPGMRPAVWDAFCETMVKHSRLYRALRVSGD